MMQILQKSDLRNINGGAVIFPIAPAMPFYHLMKLLKKWL